MLIGLVQGKPEEKSALFNLETLPSDRKKPPLKCRSSRLNKVVKTGAELHPSGGRIPDQTNRNIWQKDGYILFSIRHGWHK